MRNRFDKQLVELNNELIQMGSLIEKAIELAFSALIRQDVKRAKDAISFDKYGSLDSSSKKFALKFILFVNVSLIE